MRRTAAVFCVGLLLACQGAGKSENAVEQYRAWCWAESKPLGDWVLDRAVAEEQVAKHKKLFPHHSAMVKVFHGAPPEETSAE